MKQTTSNAQKTECDQLMYNLKSKITIKFMPRKFLNQDIHHGLTNIQDSLRNFLRNLESE